MEESWGFFSGANSCSTRGFLSQRLCFCQKVVNSQNYCFHRLVWHSFHLVFHPPLKVSCFKVLFARARRKYLEFPIENQNYAPKNVFFAIWLRFYSGFKKHCKTPVKVSGMLPKPSFLHTVSAENRFFQKLV